jgi:hypothetical protein
MMEEKINKKREVTRKIKRDRKVKKRNELLGERDGND